MFTITDCVSDCSNLVFQIDPLAVRSIAFGSRQNLLIHPHILGNSKSAGALWQIPGPFPSISLRKSQRAAHHSHRRDDSGTLPDSGSTLARAAPRLDFTSSWSLAPAHFWSARPRVSAWNRSRFPCAARIAPLADLLALLRLWWLLGSRRPDLVEFSTPKAGLLGTLAARLRGVPRRVYLLRGLKLERSQRIQAQDSAGCRARWPAPARTWCCATATACAPRRWRCALAPREQAAGAGRGKQQWRGR